MSNRITQAGLEAYLWGAANIMRGSIDAGDYKQYILPLLFYKRICDIYDEEYKTASRDDGADEDYARAPEQHKFQIPDSAHWNNVRETPKNVGDAIVGSMRAIERANSKLFGIFGETQWTDTDHLSDQLLKDLIEHFSSENLGLANLPEDEIGNGYEYLIKRFADDSGHTAKEFYTNRSLVQLMVEILDPRSGESIYDPTCGTGGMLLSSIAHLKRKGKEFRTLKLFGQEAISTTKAIALMNLFLHGVEDFHIEKGDTLSNPLFVEGDHLKQFDVVLANPPYSIKRWSRTLFSNDPWGRNCYGTPPQGRADYAFFQHILASLKKDRGRCSILFPHGVLFRNEEKEMRSKIIEDDLIECVIGLGPNLFYNSPMEACIVICKRSKPVERRNRLLFIDAVTEISRIRSQSFLEDLHIERISKAYRGFSDIAGFCEVASIEKVRENNYNLSVPKYVNFPMAPRKSSKVSLKRTVNSWITSMESSRTSSEELMIILRELKLGG